MNKLFSQANCPVELTVLLLANKWTVPILKQLMSGPKRPSDLERNLKSLSAKTLAERLHNLKASGIISRHSYPEVPPHVEYSLTSLGMQLEAVFTVLADYGQVWSNAQAEAKAASTINEERESFADENRMEFPFKVEARLFGVDESVGS